jgi:hypothetical protein
MNSLSQRSERSNVTRRALLAAPLALLPFAAAFGEPAIEIRPIGEGLACSVARTGTPAADRLRRLYERDEITVDGKRWEPIVLAWTDKGTHLSFRAL